MIHRVSALLICLSAVVGIGLEFATLVGNGTPVLRSVWFLVGYFTILTNGIVAVVFGAIAIYGKRFDHPRLVAGVVVSIVLVGVINALLLQGLRSLDGAIAAADFLLHRLNPILVAVFWLLFTPKGRLSWRDPLRWALYPLAYLVYALVRGLAQGRYSYPFIDVSTHGWIGVTANAVVIAVGLVAACEVLVLIDRMLARRANHPAEHP